MDLFVEIERLSCRFFQKRTMVFKAKGASSMASASGIPVDTFDFSFDAILPVFTDKRDYKLS